MIKQSLVKIVIELLRKSANGIFLVTGIFIALFICWFTYRFLIQLMDWCEKVLFSSPWAS